MRFTKIITDNTKLLIYLLSWFANSGLQTVSSSDFWLSTCCKFVRGTHFDTLSFLNFPRTKTCNAVDFLRLTTVRDGAHSAIWDGVFNADVLPPDLSRQIIAFKKIWHDENYSQSSKDNLQISQQDIADGQKIIKRLNVEEFSSAKMIHLGIAFKDIKIGVDLPLIMKMRFGERESYGELKSSFKSYNKFIDTNVHKLSSAVSNENQQRIANFLKLQNSCDWQLGDLRLYVEKTCYSDDSTDDCVIGIELFTVPNDPSDFIPLALSSQRSLLSKASSSNNLPDDPQRFIDNFTASLNTTYLSTDYDLMRSGVGVYIRPSVLVAYGYIELFAKIRGDFLFETDKATVFPLKNCNNLETVALIARQPPLRILQLNLGAALHVWNLHLYCGYDFYWQNRGAIGEITNVYDSNHVDISSYLAKDKAEQPVTMCQSGLFTSLGWRSSLLSCDYILALSVNGSFMSSKNIFDTTGIAITIGAGF